MFGEVTCDGDRSDLVRPAVIWSCHQGKTGIIGIRIIPLIAEAVVLYPTCIYQVGAASELFLVNPGIVEFPELFPYLIKHSDHPEPEFFVQFD